MTSAIDLDPRGVETARAENTQQQPRKYTTYERDANSSDEAMHRRYGPLRQRFDQPDPSDGSYDLTNPQSFNRYAYVNNDPVNFTDPTGLMPRFPDASQGWSGFGGWGEGFDFNHRPRWGASIISGNPHAGDVREVMSWWWWQDPETGNSYGYQILAWPDSPHRMFRTPAIPYDLSRRTGRRPQKPEDAWPTLENAKGFDEITRKGNLKRCLAAANAEFDREFRGELDRASSPRDIAPLDLGVGVENNRAWGSNVAGAVGNTVTGALAAKGIRHYWNLLAPGGFGWKFTEATDRCRSQYGN